MTPDQIKRLLISFTSPINRRLKLLVQRSVLTRVKYDGVVRVLQLKKPGGEELADIEHLEPFGFTSHPKKGAETIVLAFNGNGSHSVGLLVGDRKYRMVIEEGEVAIYNTNGDYFHLQADGTAELKSATKVIIDSPATEITGTLKVTGETTLMNKLSVADAATFSQTLQVTGTTTLLGQLGVVAAATFTAGATIQGVSFSSHTHSYTDDGNSMTTGVAQ